MPWLNQRCSTPIKDKELIQASTLELHAEHYSIHSPEQCWYGSLTLQAQNQVELIQVGANQVEAKHVESNKVESNLVELIQVRANQAGHLATSNVSIAIDSGMGVAPIIALYRLWQARHKATAPTINQEKTGHKAAASRTIQEAKRQRHVPGATRDSIVPSMAARTSLTATGQSPAMHLVVVESYPLAAEDAQLLFQTLAPDCKELQDLASQWPLLLPGMHRLELAEGRFTLSLLYGSQHSWRQVMANIDGVVLHLDGLAKQYVDAQAQQQRWRDILRLSQPKVWAIVAADEAHVLHELGGQLHTQWHEIPIGRDSDQPQYKQPQYKSSESLHVPSNQEHGSCSLTRRQYQSTEPVDASSYDSDKCIGIAAALLLQGQSKRPAIQVAAQHAREACVIGAGLAGAGIAYALALRGWQVKVIDTQFTNQQALSHSGRLSAALTPLITADDSHKARLSRAGTLRAHARWKAWGEEAGINPCGTLELNRDKGHAKDIIEAVQVLNFPHEWVRLVSAQEASTLSGLSLEKHGAFFPYGMQISPLRLIHKLLSHPLIELVCDEVDSLRLIRSDPQSANDPLPQYAIMSSSGLEIARSSQVILATALNTAELLRRSHLDLKTLKSGQVVNAISRFDTLHPMGGEAMHVPADLVRGGPQCIVAGQGYLLPAFENYCVMGGTYIHNQLNPQVSEEGQKAILRKLPLDLGLDLPSLRAQGQLGGWAGSRAVVQGRMPVIGPLAHAPGVFLACAYASHGLTWSSLAGDVIAAYLEGEPLPIERDLWQAILPR